jgi:hypothetical protein
LLGVEWPEREADHTRPQTANVKNQWSCTYTPVMCLLRVNRNNSTALFVVGLLLLVVRRDLSSSVRLSVSQVGGFVSVVARDCVSVLIGLCLLWHGTACLL